MIIFSTPWENNHNLMIVKEKKKYLLRWEYIDRKRDKNDEPNLRNIRMINHLIKEYRESENYDLFVDLGIVYESTI